MGSKICVDRLTYRQSKMSKDGNKGLLNLTDIFCLQLYIKITLAFLKILTDRQRYLFLEAPFPQLRYKYPYLCLRMQYVGLGNFSINKSNESLYIYLKENVTKQQIYAFLLRHMISTRFNKTIILCIISMVCMVYIEFDLLRQSNPFQFHYTLQLQ